MRFKLLLRASSCFLLMVWLLSACAKGKQGPKGETGAAGLNGSENVVSTDIVVPGNFWVKSQDSSEWISTVDVFQLTQDAVEKGSVQLSMKKDNRWWPLPYAEGDDFLQFGYGVNTLTLIAFSTHHILPQKPPSTSFKLTVTSPR